ncbi:double-strand break repair helicase AddA [Albidovulum sp.]
MSLDDAARAQRRAADPGSSTWLSANAGSGKTRVLTDRVARLLLRGTDPQRILCLTYTRAAASEMQNRLFQRLGEWAMLPEPELRRALADLEGDAVIDAEALARARRLFARAIETPGGLKIQTIHSFCASVLRRFPLEAGVPPNFAEIDDQAARNLRREILEELADGAQAGALDLLARHGAGDDLGALLATICARADSFGKDMTEERARALFGLPAGLDAAALVAQVFTGAEPALIAALLPYLREGGTNDRKLAATLDALRLDPPGLEALVSLESRVLSGASAAAPFVAKIGKTPTKAVQQAAPDALIADWNALMLRVERARPQRLALAAAERMHVLHRFADAFLALYRQAKAARGWLDFDDLISRTLALLSDPSVAAWVLYRLDGGIDHILVDEAQDTSPLQWQIIRRLTEEFTSGEGARAARRTLFVVGDKKQSIYSFQGADLAVFEHMRDELQARYQALAAPFAVADLIHSFRSSPAVLDIVDLTFDERASLGLGGPTKHVSVHAGLPGRVDLWAPVAKSGEAEKADWFDPVDLTAEDHHDTVLARRVAAAIRRIIDEGTRIETRPGQVKTVDEGDFLILVQRRSKLFRALVGACKAEGLAIAGADRMRAGAEIAVRDIMALLAFLATPEDDLSLAAALRSPLFGWSEAALFDLAHNRPPGSFLWAALRARAADHPETHAILRDLRDRADFLRPYDLIERILIRHDGRRRLIGRLGPEAEDGIDALVDQALAFEETSVPSLTGFLGWFDRDETEIKRPLESGAGAIRVMTVHGAKGLEAPIVILPDCARPWPGRGDEILTVEGAAVWKPRAEDCPPQVATALAARDDLDRQERMRLLYVAMTRARNWLIVAAAGDVGEGADSWYALVRGGMERAASVELPAEDPAFAPGLRYSHGAWPEPGGAAPAAAAGARPETRLPDWLERPAPAAAPAAPPLSPSDLGGAKALAGEGGQDEAAAKRRGTMAHLLLEHLPAVAPQARRAHARRLLAAAGIGADPEEAEAVIAEILAALDAPDMAPLVAAGALSEVELCAPLPCLGGRLAAGTIDRLLIAADRVLAVDFKTNAVVPPRPEEVPEGILRQMGAYAEMLAVLYPGRRIETAIFWTRTARLMPLCPEMVRAALMRTPTA